MRAGTSEWLLPCLQERLDRARDNSRASTMLWDVLGRQQAGTTASLLWRPQQRHSLSRTCRQGCTAHNQSSALQPADTTQELGCDPARRLLHPKNITGPAENFRICCPSLSSRVPTPAIARYLPCIHCPTCSTMPTRLYSGGSPSERPSPPTRTRLCYPA